MDPEQRADICGHSLAAARPWEDLSERFDAETWYTDDREVYCGRPVAAESDADRCIWHADVEGKSADELVANRGEGPERLDRALLRNADLGRRLSLNGCRLHGADFRDASLAGADVAAAALLDADLSGAYLRSTNFTAAYLKNATLTGAYLEGVILTEAYLRGADLTDVFLRNGDLTKADLIDADLTGGDLRGVDLRGADLFDADLRNVDLKGADLSEARLEETNLSGADLGNVDLTDANLEGAVLTDANLEGADVSDARLRDAVIEEAALVGTTLTNVDAEGANFARANLFDATLVGAGLYGAILSDVRLNGETEFGEHYTGSRGNPDKAAWTLRKLERLFRENALPEQARVAYLDRKDCRRRQAWTERSHWRALLMTGYGSTMRYGESPTRVVGVSLLVILSSAVLYPLVGGVNRSSTSSETTQVALKLLPTVPTSLPGPVNNLATNLYFSAITFTTLGYGDLQPATGAASAVATVESFLGALLMALLVFVLGRRATW